jgi:hypothetical protein
MKGDGGVDLVRTRTYDDAEALTVFVALAKTLGDDPPKRRSRRATGAASDDTVPSTTPAGETD